MIKKIGLLLLIAVIVSCSGTKNTGSSGNKSYLTHKIVAGDTPEALTEKYRLTVDDLRAANGGKLPAMRVGHSIRIPKNKIGSVKKEIKDPNDPMFATEDNAKEPIMMGELDFSLLHFLNHIITNMI